MIVVPVKVTVRVEAVMKVLCTLVLSVVVAGLAVAPVAAHQITFKGTVISATSTVLMVSVVDEKTKKVAPKKFVLDNETKILRGDKLVSFAAAKIQKGEKIAVSIDHDLDEELAMVVRLDEKK
jgi:hypothetical protein